MIGTSDHGTQHLTTIYDIPEAVGSPPGNCLSTTLCDLLVNIGLCCVLFPQPSISGIQQEVPLLLFVLRELLVGLSDRL